MSNIRELECLSPGTSEIELKKHQRIAATFLLRHHGLVAFHGLGSGKTLLGVAVAHCALILFPKIQIIVITPVSLQDNFKMAMKLFGVRDMSKFIFFTINGFYNKFQHKDTDWFHEYFKNKLLIIDEAHNLRSDIGVRSKLFVEICKHVFKILLLTGTPTQNRPFEIINLIAMVDGTDPVSKEEFQNILTSPANFNRFFKCKISFYLNERRTNFPERREHYKTFVMSKGYYKRYRQIETEQLKNLTQFFPGATNLQAFYNGVRRGANNLESEHGPKINWIVNKIRRNPGRRILLYSSFLNAGSELVIKRLRGLHIRYGIISGKIKRSERQKIVNQFNKGIFKVLIISKAGGEGLDLKEVRTVILMEPSWNGEAEEQIIGRAIRYKSHIRLPRNRQIVDVYHLYLRKPRPRRPRLCRFDDDDDIHEPISIDIYLKNLIMKKKKILNEFIKKLIPLTIEKYNCK